MPSKLRSTHAGGWAACEGRGSGRNGAGAEDPALDLARVTGGWGRYSWTGPRMQSLSRTEVEMMDYRPGRAKPTVLRRSKSRQRKQEGVVVSQRRWHLKFHRGGGI